MSDQPTQPQSPPPHSRRSSFAGQTFADLFGTGRQASNRSSSDNNGNGTPPSPREYPGPITSVAAHAQRRRLSLTTLGLSGSPSQGMPFGSARGRGESVGSDESAIAEDESPPSARDPNAIPFTRRTSFGARALRDIRTNSTSGGGGGGGGGGNGSNQLSSSPQQNGTRSPPAPYKTQRSNSIAPAPNGTISSQEAKGRGEGFNWSENFRTRVERTSSFAGQGGQRPMHRRAVSAAVMEPPVVEMPKPREPQRPDHFQERILKGDFYMD